MQGTSLGPWRPASFATAFNGLRRDLKPIDASLSVLLPGTETSPTMDEYDEKPYQPLWTSAEQRALIINNACLGIIGYYLVRIPLILLSYILAQLEGLRPELHYYGLVIDQISEDSVIQGAGWSGGSTIGAHFIGPLLFAFASFYLLQRWEFLWMNGISLGLIIWTSLHGFSRLLCGAVAGVFIPKFIGQVFVATGLNLGVRVVLGVLAFG
ncbi:MAG: hypothetical protein ACKOQP_00390, partial [Bacteroidota bacterium]